MPETDYYKILGIDINASDNDIKKAFRNLAKKFHPDKNPGDEKNAERKFKMIMSAYQVLIDQDKRQNYDMELRGTHNEPRRKSRKIKNDEKTLCQMILVELLKPNKEKALEIYEGLLAKIADFSLDKYMSDHDSRDCEFLLAETYHLMGNLAQAETLYKKLLEKEEKKPYFYHFSEEISDQLKSIYIQNMVKSKTSSDVFFNLQKLLDMKLTNNEASWVLKKSAEVYYRLNDIENAINSLKSAFNINPKLTGAKKISRKLGFRVMTENM